MNIVISNTSDAPIYQQIYDQISLQIIRGDIPSDFCLPPIRTVAKELRISVITVKRAWEELEHAGYIYTMAGKGCFVASLQSKELNDKKSRLAMEKLTKDIEYLKSLGFTLPEIVEMITCCYNS